MTKFKVGDSVLITFSMVSGKIVEILCDGYIRIEEFGNKDIWEVPSTDLSLNIHH